MESCTSEVQASAQFTVGDKQVVLIDTPGFGDTTMTDSDIWKIIAASFVTRHVHRYHIVVELTVLPLQPQGGHTLHGRHLHAKDI